MSAEQSPPPDQLWYVYRAFNDRGRLLYAGFSCDPERRFDGHQRSARWFPEVAAVTAERHPDREAARAAETMAIRSEWPLWNVHQSPDGTTARQSALDEWTAERDRWLRSGTLCPPALHGAAKLARERKAEEDFRRRFGHLCRVRGMVRRAVIDADISYARLLPAPAGGDGS